MMPEYEGGFWHFIRLPDGGGYMMPEYEGGFWHFIRLPDGGGYMMPEYEGGFWHFIRLPDGGGYMMPDGDRFHLVNGENSGLCVARMLSARGQFPARGCLRV
ncbi:putative antirestriction protein [Escherichia coli]|nr:putative antirestriction protein [Escherichia coli]